MKNREEGKISPGDKPIGRLSTVLMLLVLFAGAVLVALDWERFASVLMQADWKVLLGALALTVLSYLCVSTAFAIVSRLLGIEMSYRALAETGFVSIVLNHVLTTGGVAGYSIRYLLMRRQGVALKDIVAASILHFYLTSLDMLAMLPVGFLYLFLKASLPAGVTALVGLMTMLMTVVAALATALIFKGQLRRRLARWLNLIGRRFLHRDIGESIQQMDLTLTRAVEVMRRQPLTVLLVMALTWVDWFASVGVVWLCFDALSAPMP